MLQSKTEIKYDKLGMLFKGYASKVYLVREVAQQQESENKNPNVNIKQDGSRVFVLKKYFRKVSILVNNSQKSESTDLGSLNECSMLKGLSHPNIVALKDIFVEKLEFKNNICLSLELMAPLHQLYGKLDELDIQYCFSKIVQGLCYLKSQAILHRDIKPANIFIDLEGNVRIGDFGIAKRLQPDLTSTTTTKNYRAPELFFGDRNYGHSIDVWSLGCTLAEMVYQSNMYKLTGQILFQGKSEIEILSNITNLIGVATEENWIGCQTLPNYLEFIPNESTSLKMYLSNKVKNDQVIEFIQNLLILDPTKRPSIEQVASEPYITSIENRQTKISILGQALIAQTIKKYEMNKEKKHPN